jgi:LuxR family maltose regulon positive regulatory protein
MLATKFIVPLSSIHTIFRHQAVDRLNQEWRQSRQIIVLQGPAGYGKTTAMAQFAQHCEKQNANVSWVSLDVEDNHPKQLLLCLLHALESDINKQSSALYTVHKMGEEEVMDALLSKILNEEKEAVIIFIDDLHYIDDAATLLVLGKLIKSTIGKLTLCCGSREAFPVNRGRLITHGHLFQLGINDLRFNIEESRLLQLHISPASLNDESLSELHNKIDGWPALLTMALAKVSSSLHADAWVKNFSGRHEDVVMYMAEEVLSGLNNDIAQALLEISILHRFTHSLCDAVTGMPRIIEKLSNEPAINLLMQRLDEENRWFRVHPLLRDVLLQRLELTYSHHDQQALYQRASLWCEDNGRTYSAIKYSLSANDTNRAVALLQDHGFDLIADGYFQHFLELVEQLPEKELIENKKLLFQQVWTQLVTLEDSRCEQVIQTIKDLYSNNQLMPDAVAFELQVVDLCRCLYNDNSQSIIERAPRLLAVDIHLDEAYIKNSIRTAYVIALYRNNDISQALKIIDDCIPVTMTAGMLYSAMLAWSLKVVIRLTRGQIGQAHEEMKKIRYFMDGRVEDDSLIYSFVQPLDAVIRYFMGDVENAHRLMGGQSVLNNFVADTSILFWAVPIQVRLLEELQNVDAAINSLQYAWNFAKQKQLLGLLACVGGELIRLYTRTDESEKGQVILDEIHQDFAKQGKEKDTIVVFFLVMAESRLAMHFGNVDSAIESLLCLHKDLLAQGRYAQQLECQLVLAEAYLKINKDKLCKAILLQAMKNDLAKESTQLFRCASETVLIFFAKMEKTVLLSNQKRLINDVIKGTSFQDNASKNDVLPLIEELSPGENKVLSRLVTGMTNQSIAIDLELSINTIKTHLKSAYGKLNVSNRVQAVSRLKELGLYL